MSENMEGIILDPVDTEGTDGGEEAAGGDKQLAVRNELVDLPGTDDDGDDEREPNLADVNWHDFESQYSIALAQSAIVEREKWGSNIEFLLSCISSAVGLGNIWRFPYVAANNGGGAFLIPYFIVVFFVGRPLYYLELSLGQFSSRGPVKAWEMVPLFRGVGYGTGLASFLVTTFYVTIMAWTLLYFGYSFNDPLPWGGPENSEKFFVETIFRVGNETGYSTMENKTVNSYELDFQTGRGLGWPSPFQVAALFSSWVVIWAVLVKGVSGSGKVAYFTAIFPYVVLFTLLIKGALLDGAKDGILYFVYPNFNAILSPKTWFEAVNQCFFSLGVGFGGCIMFSSYNHFNHNLGRDVLIISIVDTITSFLAGITIFSILGNVAHVQNKNVSDVSKQGAALAFVTYPGALETFGPFPAPQIFAILFFLMILTLGIGSASALAGTSITIVQDAFPNVKKWIIVTLNCVLGFVGGIIYTCPAGSNIIDLIDTHGASFCIFVLAFLEVVGVFYIYGLQNYTNDLEFMMGKKLGLYWSVSWILLPILLVIIFMAYLILFQVNRTWHWSTIVAGWILTFCVLIIPIIMGFQAVKSKKSSKWYKRFRASLYPTKRWGPKDPIIKEAWRRYKKTKPIEMQLTKKLKSFFAKLCGVTPRPQLTLSAFESQMTTAVQSTNNSRYESNVNEVAPPPNTALTKVGSQQAVDNPPLEVQSALRVQSPLNVQSAPRVQSGLGVSSAQKVSSEQKKKGTCKIV